jgi:hypothetical protein
MKPDSALTAFCIFLAGALAFGALLYTCQAKGSEQRGTLAALRALPVFHADRAPELADEKRAQLEAFATAIDRHATDKRVRAFLIAWGWHESAFSLAITDGQCDRHQCDYSQRLKRHLASGAFQEHQNGRPDAEWSRLRGLENIDHQVASASRRARGFIGMCPTIEGAFRALGGRGCDGRLPDAGKRVATYQRTLGRL